MGDFLCVSIFVQNMVYPLSLSLSLSYCYMAELNLFVAISQGNSRPDALRLKIDTVLQLALDRAHIYNENNSYMATNKST